MNFEESFSEFNDSIYNTNSFVVFHQNISSVRENFNSFSVYLNSLKIKPHVIILSEIWINTCEVDMYKISGYNQFACCNDSYRSGGVMVYVSDTFAARQLDVCVASADMVKVTINVAPAPEQTAHGALSLSLTVVAIYRLHAHSVNAFLADISRVLESCTDKNLLVIGDMNLCLLKQSAAVDEYLSTMASFGLEQQIYTPTRGNSCLDHVFLRSRDVLDVKSRVFSSGRSDHDVSVCEMLFEVVPLRNKKQIVSETKRLDYNMLNNFLENVDWTPIYSQHNVSIGFNMFVDIIKNSIEKSLVSKCTKNSKYKFLKPWMSVDLCKRITFRNLLNKKAKNRPQDRHFQLFVRSFSKKLKLDIEHTKRNYYYNLFDKNKHDVKKQWRTINSIVGKQKEKREIECIQSFKNPETIISDKYCIAEEFNNFFVSVVTDLLHSAESPNNILVNDHFKRSFPVDRVVNSFFCHPSDQFEIERCIDSLSNNKAPGLDGISAATLKSIKKFILPAFTFLINSSLEKGEFPNTLKDALVIPVHKKGNVRDVNNYRPISLLPIFSKIIEKIMKKRLLKYLNSINYFSENQFGFTENKSTEDALIGFSSDLFEGLNNNMCTSGIFVDITKAFDSVNHDILVDRLCEAGIRGIPLNWFRSYLTGRRQCVGIQGVKSSNKSVVHGVPQGSVLGPILFLIYINNLCKGNFSGSLTCFADDTALCYSATSNAQLWHSMQNDMDKLKYWFTLNRLVLSDKTKYIKFFLKHDKNFPYNIVFKCAECLANTTNNCTKCIEIDKVDSIKYLGVVIDENCNWKQHILKLKSYLNSALRTFYNLKQICPIDILKTVYFSIINSKLQYGIVCWGGTYLSTVKVINVSQKKILRVMCGAKNNDPSFPLFKSLKIFPLRYLFVFRVLRIFFIRGGHSRGNTNVHSVRLQSRNRFPTPLPRTEAFKRQYTYCATKLFNELPLCVTSSKSLPIFLKKLKIWLFSVSNIEVFF